MSRYKHIYFDLDRTLWDFERNAQEAFYDLYQQFHLNRFIPSEQHLINRYHFHNEKLWEEYRKGMIKKDYLRVYRFQLVLNDFDILDAKLAKDLSRSYLDIAPMKTNLIPYTETVLNYLINKYSLHIITNGFSEIQKLKLKNSGIINYFKGIVTSDSIGVQKPKPEIFEHALRSVNAKKKESIMIGDDLLVDILGAKRFGMDQVYLNPSKERHNQKITFEISSLLELKSIF